MSWFYLALLAPVLYAVVNLIDDNLLNFVYESPYIAAVIAGLFGLLPAAGRLFIQVDRLSTFLSLLAVGAGFFTLVYLFYYFKGLEADNPSIVIALFSLAPATIPFLAHFIVHERLTAGEIGGFTVVLLASLGIAVEDFKSFRLSKALVPVLIAVVFMDAETIMAKYVYQRTTFFSAYWLFSIGMGLGGLLFLLLKLKANREGLLKIKPALKKLLPIFIVAEATAAAAEITLNLALSRGPASLVKVIESIQPMFVLLIALALYPKFPKYFREARGGHVWRKLGFMAAAVFGLALLSIASKL